MAAGQPIYWEWVRVVRRAELGFGEGKKRVSSSKVQHVGLVTVTYGNPDGTNIRPSVDRLARVCRVDEKTVRLCLGRLRDVGLLERIFEGSTAGRDARCDEYRAQIPGDLWDRVPLLDPDERRLVVPAGAVPPPVRKPRAKKAGLSPGAAPAVPPVDNSCAAPGSPGAAPADPELPSGNHRVQHPGTPGAAPEITGCSTRPPTQRPPIDLPDAHDPPYGGAVEGRRAGRREPPAGDHQRRSHQPPLMVGLPAPGPAGPPADSYESARDFLQSLPDLGSGLMADARRAHPTATLQQLVIQAARLARRRIA